MKKRLSVLIVDDDIEVVQDLRMRLLKEGYIVDNALTSKEAKEKCTGSGFDTVLLSTELRDMPLKNLITHLATCFGRSNIVLMTSYLSLEDGLNALDVGVYDILMKPIGKAELLRVVEDTASARKSAKFWMGKNPRTRKAVTEYRIKTEKGIKTTMQEISKKYDWNPAVSTIRRNLSEFLEAMSDGSEIP